MCVTTVLYIPLNPCVWVHALIYYIAHHQWHAVARLLGGMGSSEACHLIRDDKISALGQYAAADSRTDLQTGLGVPESHTLATMSSCSSNLTLLISDHRTSFSSKGQKEIRYCHGWMPS